MGATALLAYIVVGGFAWLLDRRPVDAAARLPAAASRA
jgi:hypothetical protein